MMTAIANCNRLVCSSRIARSAVTDGENTLTLSRSVALEQVVGLLVLAAVAVLGTTHPVRRGHEA